MYFVKVYVTYKESILDPQGEAVKEAVHRLGFTEVAEIRVGKYFEMHVQQTEAIEGSSGVILGYSTLKGRSACGGEELCR